MTSLRPIKDKGRRPDIEAMLRDDYTVDFAYLSNVDTTEFDIDKSLHNQARFEPVDEATVATYQDGVERGDQFPAVLAWRPGRGANPKLVVIDGNHRVVAHDRAGVPLDVYEIDRATKPQTVALMTFAFNTRHGRPTTEAERISQALYLIEGGASQADAAAAVNLGMGVLKRALAKANADKRADEVGVDRREWDSLGQSSKSRLLNIKTDEGFHDAVHLAFAARLNVDELFDLVNLLNTSQSGRKQSQLVKDQTAAYTERIQDNAGGVLATGGRRPMSDKARLAMVLGQISALPDDVNGIARSYHDAERPEQLTKIADAIEKLSKYRQTIESQL